MPRQNEAQDRTLQLLQGISTKLDDLESIDEKLGQLLEKFPGPTPQAVQGEGDATQPDPLDVLRFVEALIGKNENDDYDELMGLFKKHGIVCGDIRQDMWAWCAILLRVALVAAGFQDPGEKYNRACNWVDVGEEEPDPMKPATLLVYLTHISLRTEDGGEVSGNVRNEVKKTPPGQKWFGDPIATRRIV